MDFAFQENWPWLLIALPAILFIIFIFVKSEKVVRSWFMPSDYKLFEPTLNLVLRIAAFLCLAFALVGPYWGQMEQKVDIMGREIYLLLDVSASMNSADIKPSRLEKVKQELKRMIQDLKGDKVGLIVFTADAYVQCPLTNDMNAMNLFIDLIRTDQFANTGTNFRAGLSMALDRFLNTESRIEKITRSIVLISDGEDFGDTYSSVIERLKDNGIKVFSVGIGTYDGAPVPELVYGQMRGYKKGADGKPAISKLNDESLISLADEFKTEYHKIDEQIDDFKPITEQIKLQSAAILDSKIEQVNNNRYQLFLLISLFCFTFSFFWKPISKQKR